MPVFQPFDDSKEAVIIPFEKGRKSPLILPEVGLLDQFDFKNFRDKLTFCGDVEWSYRNKCLKIEAIGIASPQILNGYCLVFTKEELNKEFHPIETYINSLGNNCKILDKDYLNLLTKEFEKLNDDLIDNTQSPKEISKDFEKVKENFEEPKEENEAKLKEFCLKHNIDKESIILKRENKKSILILQPQKLKIELLNFFQPADLFKLGGEKYQQWLLDSKISSYRTIRGMEKLLVYGHIDGTFYEMEVELRDNMHRFPPRKKGLNDQAETFDIEGTKIDLDVLKPQLDLPKEANVKEHMDLVNQAFPELFAKYNAVDVELTLELDRIQREFLSIIRNDFDLEDVEIADTTGKNVATLIIDLISKHFGLNDKEGKKLLNSIIKLTKAENLQDIELNDFGIQAFLTVGGILFSRTAKYPYLKGLFKDNDLASAYAAIMSKMNIYLGEPITLTFKYEESKRTIREILELVDEKKLGKENWFARVSGKFNKVINTLLMSDLRFTSKSVKIPTKFDLNKNRKSIEQFNAEKTGKKQADSTILTKEAIFAYINADELEALKTLPEEWYEEYLNLKVDVLVYIPNELIANNYEEYLKIQERLPKEKSKEKFDLKNGWKSVSTQYHKGNVCLKFPISEYWSELAAKRQVYKKAKNPVQEVYKLFNNSGYGVLACLFLTTNNLMASNYITAKCRTGAWLMTYALNGLSVITDGCAFNELAVPINRRFKDLVRLNPEYMIDYDDNIKSDLKEEINQKWINKNLKQHIASFYELDESSEIIQQFDYDLKTEKFTDKKGKNVEITRFTKYYNTNAGNYVKGLEDCSLLIEDIDYDFSSQESNIKARSFKGDDENLASWYISSLEKYKEPLIYSEREIIKFGDGNRIATNLLQQVDVEEICHPMGHHKDIYKMMKLISRSQFLFQTELQLRNFETNEHNLSELSKHIFNKKFWDDIKPSDVEPYNALLVEGVDYYGYSKTHPVGIGFEILALSKKYNGNIKSIRELIYTKILEGCENFNAKLNINRSFDNVEPFKYLLAAVIILKKNAEDDLKQRLISSLDEPLNLKANRGNVKTLSQIWDDTDDE